MNTNENMIQSYDEVLDAKYGAVGTEEGLFVAVFDPPDVPDGEPPPPPPQETTAIAITIKNKITNPPHFFIKTAPFLFTNKKAFSELKIKRSDEIGLLSSSMIQMEKDIDNYGIPRLVDILLSKL